jgi:hypothetical protein
MRRRSRTCPPRHEGASYAQRQHKHRGDPSAEIPARDRVGHAGHIEPGVERAARLDCDRRRVELRGCRGHQGPHQGLHRRRSGAPVPSAQHSSDCKPAAATRLCASRTPLAPGGPARSPFLRLSIGIQSGPQIGAQKGPRLGRAEAMRGAVRRSAAHRRSALAQVVVSGAVLEAPGIVTGLEDVAVMGEPV